MSSMCSYIQSDRILIIGCQKGFLYVYQVNNEHQLPPLTEIARH
jgi:hypothetical protein